MMKNIIMHYGELRDQATLSDIIIIIIIYILGTNNLRLIGL